MLRHYEEQGLLQPALSANGYRSYGSDDVQRAQQVHGLLDCGLTTEIIRSILPCCLVMSTGPNVASTS
jgi:DNA-binding transcriptional MerR regulator